MEIEFTELKNNLVVKPEGEIDHHATADMRHKIERAFSHSRARNIIFDFSAVSFMDSSGIGILIGRYKELAKQGGLVCAVNVGGSLMRIFNVSGLSRIIRCYDSLEEALTNAGGR